MSLRGPLVTPQPRWRRCHRVLLGLAAVGLAGCGTVLPRPAPATGPVVGAPASEPQSAGPWTDGAGAVRYRCEAGYGFSVRLADDTAQLQGLPQGPQLLLRDAGGLQPLHTVFANSHLRAEFGLGPDGSQALLHFLQPSAPSARCARG